MPQLQSENVQSQQMLATQYSSGNQRVSQGLQQNTPLDDTQVSLQQLLQLPMSRATISPVQQLRMQPSQNRAFYQQQLATLRQQQQQQQQLQQQQLPSQQQQQQQITPAMMNQLKRQYKGEFLVHHWVNSSRGMPVWWTW